MRVKGKSSKTSVYAALVGNLLVAATKAFAAFRTGSSALLSEAIHSFVDSANEILLLYGMRRARQPADESHPLGHGREFYFWSFIVALLIFALGGGVSVYEGIGRIHQPEPIRSPTVNYVVLGLAFVFEFISWNFAVRQFNSVRNGRGYYEAFVRSKDPASFIVIFEDSAALIGIAIAAMGVSAAVWLDNPVYDGAASILIGVLLIAISMLLAREAKSLLIGERADPSLTKSILAIASNEPGVTRARDVMTVRKLPRQVDSSKVEFPAFWSA